MCRPRGRPILDSGRVSETAIFVAGVGGHVHQIAPASHSASTRPKNFRSDIGLWLQRSVPGKGAPHGNENTGF